MEGNQESWKKQKRRKEDRLEELRHTIDTGRMEGRNSKKDDERDRKLGCRWKEARRDTTASETAEEGATTRAESERAREREEGRWRVGAPASVCTHLDMQPVDTLRLETLRSPAPASATRPRDGPDSASLETGSLGAAPPSRSACRVVACPIDGPGAVNLDAHAHPTACGSRHMYTRWYLDRKMECKIFTTTSESGRGRQWKLNAPVGIRRG